MSTLLHVVLKITVTKRISYSIITNKSFIFFREKKKLSNAEMYQLPDLLYHIVGRALYLGKS